MNNKIFLKIFSQLKFKSKKFLCLKILLTFFLFHSDNHLLALDDFGHFGHFGDEPHFHKVLKDPINSRRLETLLTCEELMYVKDHLHKSDFKVGDGYESIVYGPFKCKDQQFVLKESRRKTGDHNKQVYLSKEWCRANVSTSEVKLVTLMGKLYLMQKYLSGGTLSEFLEDTSDMDEEELDHEDHKDKKEKLEALVEFAYTLSKQKISFHDLHDFNMVYSKETKQFEIIDSESKETGLFPDETKDVTLLGIFPMYQYKVPPVDEIIKYWKKRFFLYYSGHPLIDQFESLLRKKFQ